MFIFFIFFILLGFYRVNYDEENWKLISDYLKTSDREKIHPLNRAQLMNDALTFYEQEALDIQTLLDLTNGLMNEKDLTVWLQGLEIIEMLENKLMNTKHYPQYMVLTNYTPITLKLKKSNIYIFNSIG